MGTILAMVFGFLLVILGFIFCFVHKIPGQLLAFIGLLVIKFAADLPVPAWALIVCTLLVIISMLVDRLVLPILAKRIHEYGKASTRGTIIGSLIALLVGLSVHSTVWPAIICFFTLPYILAYLFEFGSVKKSEEAFQRAGAGYIVFLCSTLLKLIVVFLCLYLPMNSQLQI